MPVPIRPLFGEGVITSLSKAASGLCDKYRRGADRHGGAPFLSYRIRRAFAGRMGTRRFDTSFSFAQAKADVAIRCAGCGRRRTLRGTDFSRLFGLPLPIAEARRRLRCAACGARGPELAPLPRQGPR
jgi:hypothetical protein